MTAALAGVVAYGHGVMEGGRYGLSGSNSNQKSAWHSNLIRTYGIAKRWYLIPPDVALIALVGGANGVCGRMAEEGMNAG